MSSNRFPPTSGNPVSWKWNYAGLWTKLLAPKLQGLAEHTEMPAPRPGSQAVRMSTEYGDIQPKQAYHMGIFQAHHQHRSPKLIFPTKSQQISEEYYQLKPIMEDPRAEIRDVVRSITEPQDPQTVLKNVDKYFTDDAFILHPMANQPQMARGKDNLKALYYMFRKGTKENKIHFNAVMFSEDLTQCAIDLIEDVKDLKSVLLPGFPVRPLSIRFLVLVDLRLEADGKYRIWRQHDNFISDLGMSGLKIFPGASLISDVIKASGALFTIVLGRYFAGNMITPQKQRRVD
ncbi:hypothetical protein PtA15_6A206 [Puccinia triticina]|uniref:SigF-like NTF2-like domain-containing protein n=1 Tax=Puccinia triticina TaxID=208348 RepID=A0ABY7CKX8_9BASI|nr:uncharacterized protein PtA15_6A206 [Puccinia triticina]WAQ85578.1 hypothetical protein PtA15_6A206 [Puccinia triticina]